MNNSGILDYFETEGVSGTLKKVNNLSYLWIIAYWRCGPFKTIQSDLVNWFDQFTKASFTQRFRKIHGSCAPGIIPVSFDFGSFTLPVIFRNLCVRSHTTRKDPVKTRDISCDVYNALRTISLNWRTISASARIVRSSLIAASFQFTHFSLCEC